MKVFGIIGAVLFAVAVGIGFFGDFAGDALVQIALSAFGLASIVIGNVKKAKDEGKFTWKTVVCIILAVAGGVLCAVGGFADSIFATVSGAVVALLAIIFGIISAKKE